MNIIKSLYQRFKTNFYWSEELLIWSIISVATQLMIAVIIAPNWMWKYIFIGLFMIPTLVTIREFVKVLTRK